MKGLCHDERPDDCTVQSAWVQAGGGRVNLVAVDGEVLAMGEGEGYQGHLQDRTASPWR